MIWIPAKSGVPVPCSLFLHGLGGNKTNAAPFAVELLKKGYATMSLDAAYHGERAAGKQPMYGTTFHRLRDGYIQTVVDYRRALDYLETRTDIDTRRVTLIGLSMGALMGAVLGGVESRIKCPVLLVGGADRGMMSRLSQIEVWKKIRAENPKLDFDEISRIMAPADALNFVDKISPVRSDDYGTKGRHRAWKPTSCRTKRPGSRRRCSGLNRATTPAHRPRR